MLGCFYASLALAIVSAQSVSSAAAPFVAPTSRYSGRHSFRGLTPDTSKVQNYGVSGHATTLPGVHDFLRLVPPTPLAHGAVFSDAPLTAEEWIVEIAFRVHGPPASGMTEKLEDGTTKRIHKGGRGLAFWYTKQSSPGPLTMSTDPKAITSPPPPASPELPRDPTDSSVSMFGSRTQFDGLGVIFDTSPTQPLYSRSDRRNWASTDMHHGLGASSGVVSGVLDDGSGQWLEPDTRVMKAEDEAAYLEKAIGECEAMFRNANGLLYSRISYINNTIRVDLDLAPHTTLSKAGRDYAHNCFSMPDLKLSPGYHIGVSGLASGYSEPDTVDIYAIDVFEVVKEGEDAAAKTSEEAPEEKDTIPLEGTSEDASLTLAQEIFVSQARMMEAIDGFSRQLDYLARLVRPLVNNAVNTGRPPAVPVGPMSTAADALLDRRLSQIETQLQALVASSPNEPIQRDDKETFKHLVQLQDRLMVELQAFGRKLDTANGQSTASLATLSSRSAESLMLLKNAGDLLEKIANKKTSVFVWIGGVAAFVAALTLLLRRKRGDPWSRKMI